jgi:hypothetical protein
VNRTARPVVLHTRPYRRDLGKIMIGEYWPFASFANGGTGGTLCCKDQGRWAAVSLREGTVSEVVMGTINRYYLR